MIVKLGVLLGDHYAMIKPYLTHPAQEKEKSED
jgi:hypothetical protein